MLGNDLGGRGGTQGNHTCLLTQCFLGEHCEPYEEEKKPDLLKSNAVHQCCIALCC